MANEKPGYSLDTLLGGKVKLRQSSVGYRVAVDTLFLAAAIPARGGERILEVGAGNGAASLCLAARVPDCRIWGVERDPAALALARANAALNGWEHRVEFLTSDVAELPEHVLSGAFDHVFANPPYLEPARADIRSGANNVRDPALVESEVPLTQWTAIMLRCLRPKGRFTMIQRADRLDDVLGALCGRVGEIVICPLWPKRNRPAKRVIVTARLGVATPLRLAPGLVVHNDDGSYSSRAREILERAEALTI